MNPIAKEFVLSIDRQECKKFRLAFSFKATKTSITHDRVCIVFHKFNLDNILYLLDKFVKIKSETTNYDKIKEWVKFKHGDNKTIIFSFTGNTRKIYIERGKGDFSYKEEFFNYSIEWKVGDEENFIHRNYTWVRKNPNEYRNLISPDLYPFLDFSKCLLRTDNNLYIRHSKRIELNQDLSIPLFKTLLNLQDGQDEDFVKTNATKLKRWLEMHARRNATFNWIQITPDSLTVYVC